MVIKMKERRRKRRMRLLRLFFGVLGSVLGVGALAMVLLHFAMPEEEKVVYEIFHLPSSPLEIFAAGAEPEKEQSQDEMLLQEALEQNQEVYLAECESQDTVTLLFAGDILMDDHYAVMSTYHNRGNDINQAFDQGLLEQMRNADIFMINNEFTFTSRGTPTVNKKFTFRANPGNVSMYEEMGVDIVSVANNHIYDYGEISLLDTLDTLEQAEIPYVGAGRNLQEAMTPVYYIANGMKIAFVSATQIERNSVPDTKEATQDSAGVLRCMNPDNLLLVIEEAKKNSDYVILYIHWGTESQEAIDWLQEQQAPIYAQAGVDLIIGDHPHCLQKMDSVEGVPVIYSLGNFWFNSRTQNSCVVKVTLRAGEIESFQFIPCRQSDCRTALLTGQEKTEVLDYMRTISPNVTIDEEGYVFFDE
ncbi:MAG: CapA family protein [Lachnospiraceae bacterium]|nr:CapA family protein [Lachnospiraceae bacterium]